MSDKAKAFLRNWIVTTAGVLVAANVVRGIHYDSVTGLVLGALLLGILNAFVRPVLIILALPLLIFTLGLFVLVINALLLYFVGGVIHSFHVDSFGAAFFGSIIVGFISLLSNWLLGSNSTHIRILGPSSKKRSRHRGGPDDLGGTGPVIDV